MSTLLELKQLGLKVGSRWLFRDFNFTLESGKLVALMGPSGSGKSTLLEIIAGLRTPSEGTVKKHGKAHLMFQNFELCKAEAAWTNVASGASARVAWYKPMNFWPSTLEKEAANLLDQWGLLEQADHLTDLLSGGEQQRLAWCRLLMSQPDVLLCDEPISQLNEKWASALMKQLQELCHDSKTRKAGLVVLHDQKWAEKYCDEIIKIEDHSSANVA